MDDDIDELEKLKDLLGKNIIDKKEFSRIKNDILQKSNIPVSAVPIPAAKKTLESGIEEQKPVFLKFVALLLIAFIIIIGSAFLFIFIILGS